MKDGTSMNTWFNWSALGFFLAFSALWFFSLFGVTSEMHQGEVYRILYVHVPAAFSAFFASFLLFVFSVLGLLRRKNIDTELAKAASEVGFIFTIITLATGSIWGKPTWGVWWTWDARLTTTFLLMLLYGGYLICFASFEPGSTRNKVCSILGILIFADVPIIYKSVTWWRTLHQPPSLFRPQGSTMAPEILLQLGISIGLTLAFCLWLIRQRQLNLSLKSQIEQRSLLQLTPEG